ncbi:DUF664 domain-containing protein [Bacillus mangrovi]|uniref:DUF664 domain-containing protein n=1 Tax=Metabacillus mangrovi TaxID=1491830 RepID=A0A7X2S912_9BACI|nr:DinB family protein [Metabacillus mangrovi]MTH55700.1 DUF664 domain-containing protein [Metabacillus mangrovi]
MENHPVMLYAYNVWAHKRIFTHLKTFSPEIFHRELNSTFSSIAATMTHIYTTEYLWLQALVGKEMSEAMTEAQKRKGKLEEMQADEMEKEFQALDAQFQSFFEACEDLEATFLLNNPYAGARETSYSEVIFHIVNHSTYHRGNISAMLHELGEASVMTDYVYYWYSDALTEKNE